MDASIFLMRHGQPVGIAQTPVSARNMAEWIAAYDRAEIATGQPPPAAAQTLADREGMALLSSPTPRALSSATRLARGRRVIILPDAREAELPVWAWRGPLLRPVLWATAFRLGWYLGMDHGAESLADARRRAQKAAAAAIGHTKTGQPVLLVGHGIMNVLVASALRRGGWAGPRYPSGAHWGWSEYSSSSRRQHFALHTACAPSFPYIYQPGTRQ